MITLFAIPKAFKGDVARLQTNAITSWTRLDYPVEIILFGNDEGTASLAKKLNVLHIPEIQRNEFGTPIIPSFFDSACQKAAHFWISYVNADVILTNSFVEACLKISQTLPRCLAVGRSWDVHIAESLQFGVHWQEELKKNAVQNGKLHSHAGSDFFFFPKGLYPSIPPFTIGRAVFDNWLLYHTRSLHIPIVDVTSSIFIVHQNHDYLHHPDGAVGVYRGIEAKRNNDLAGGYSKMLTLRDCDYEFEQGSLKKKKNSLHYRFYRWVVSDSGLYTPLFPVIKLLRFFKRIILQQSLSARG